MDNQDKQVLVKIFNYADSIQNYCVNCNTLSDFIKNKMRTEACAHNLIQISRTCQTELSDQIKSEINSIPWERLCNYQNELEHDTSGNNLNIVWNIVHEDIPKLVNELTKYHREGNAFLDDSQINNPIIYIKRFLKRTPKPRLLLFAMSCFLFLYPCFSEPSDGVHDARAVTTFILSLIGFVLILCSFVAQVCFPYCFIKSKSSGKVNKTRNKFIIPWVAAITVPIALLVACITDVIIIIVPTTVLILGTVSFIALRAFCHFIDKQANRTIRFLRILNLFIYIPSFFWIALSFIYWARGVILLSYFAYIGTIVIYYVSKRMFNKMQEMIASQTNEAASAKRHDEESNKVPDKGPDEESNKGPDKGPDEDTDKGPDEESNKEPDEK